MSPEQLSNLYNNLGTAFAAKGDVGQALANYLRAIELTPDNSIPYVNRGDLRFQRREFDAAIEDFNIALRSDPTFERAYIGRTVAYLKKGDAENALKSADEMVAHEPGSAIAVEGRAYVLKEIGRRDDAIAEYRKALTMSADIPELRQEIEATLQKLGATP